MKVIFLDIDGVLNSGALFMRFHEQHGRVCGSGGMHEQLDPEAIQRLNRLTEQTGAKIVLSSTWRMHYGSAEEAQEFFWRHDVEAPFVGMTDTEWSPWDEHFGDRGQQIDRWLKASLATVSSFVILDDDSDMAPHMDRLVRTSYQTGLTDCEVDKAIAMLNKEETNDGEDQ